jgi:ribosomal protein S18 acetylase RimI-like enzyme
MTTAPLTTTSIATTPLAEAEQAISVIVLAFDTDPLARWIFPHPHTYLARSPVGMRAFAGRAFAAGTAHHVEGFQGAGLWLPPGAEPDQETLMAEFERHVPGERLADLLGLFERMGSVHPQGPHWYLPLIGVDPVHQRKGLGSALLRHALEIIDRDRLPAYLESSNPLNIPLYQRHGFELLDTLQVGSSPPVYPMLRRAQ